MLLTGWEPPFAEGAHAISRLSNHSSNGVTIHGQSCKPLARVFFSSLVSLLGCAGDGVAALQQKLGAATVGKLDSLALTARIAEVDGGQSIGMQGSRPPHAPPAPVPPEPEPEPEPTAGPVGAGMPAVQSAGFDEDEEQLYEESRIVVPGEKKGTGSEQEKPAFLGGAAVFEHVFVAGEPVILTVQAGEIQDIAVEVPPSLTSFGNGPCDMGDTPAQGVAPHPHADKRAAIHLHRSLRRTK